MALLLQSVLLAECRVVEDHSLYRLGERRDLCRGVPRADGGRRGEADGGELIHGDKLVLALRPTEGDLALLVRGRVEVRHRLEGNSAVHAVQHNTHGRDALVVIEESDPAMEDGDVIEKGAGYRPRKLVVSVPRDGVRGRWGRGEPCRRIGVDEDGQNRKICVVLFLPYLNTMYLQVHETPPFFTRNITFHAVCVFI